MTANVHPKDLRSVNAALRRHLRDTADIHLGEVIDLHESNVGRRKLRLTDGEATDAFEAFTSRQTTRLIIDCPAARDAINRLATPELGPGRADCAESDVREAMRRSLALVQEGVDALAQDGLSPSEAADIASRLRLFQSAAPHWLANLDARAAQGVRP